MTPTGAVCPPLPIPADTLPSIVLVLDYSSSMSLPLVAGEPAAIDALEAAVLAILDEPQLAGSAFFGAVFFSTGVLDQVEVGPDAPQAIRARMEALGPDGWTGTDRALGAARKLLAAAPPGPHVAVLVTDGTPCPSGNECALLTATEWAAADLRADGAAVYTVGVSRAPTPRALVELLVVLGGTATSGADPAFRRLAHGAAEIRGALRAIVACATGWPDRRPPARPLLRPVAGTAP